MRNISWCPCLKVRVNFHPLINHAAQFAVAGNVTQLYGYYQSRVVSVSVTRGWNFITLIRFITSRPRADNRPHAASQGEMKKLVRYRHLQTDTRQDNANFNLTYWL